jgi:drug/metabolite transporter (DMT)-like permease
MLVIWLGALLVFVGVLFMAAQPIWRGQLSGRRSRSEVVGANTLEPRTPGAGFGLATNWPGLVLILLGALLLLVGAAL